LYKTPPKILYFNLFFLFWRVWKAKYTSASTAVNSHTVSYKSPIVIWTGIRWKIKVKCMQNWHMRYQLEREKIDSIRNRIWKMLQHLCLYRFKIQVKKILSNPVWSQYWLVSEQNAGSCQPEFSMNIYYFMSFEASQVCKRKTKKVVRYKKNNADNGRNTATSASAKTF